MKKPIYVVYDSGVGGLTVLAEIIKQNIKSNFVYVGDTKNAPYGDKTPNQIIQFVKDNLLKVQENHLIKGVIMACNTASILAKKAIEDFFHFPVYSVSESILSDVEQEEDLWFLTTKATEKSGFFQKKQEKSNVLACENFVPLIESKRFLFEEYRKEIVREQVEKIDQQQCKKIVLACTHFPFLKKEIEEATKNQIPVYDPSEQFVRKLHGVIEETFFDLSFVITGSVEDFESFLRERLGWEKKEQENKLEKEAI